MAIYTKKGDKGETSLFDKKSSQSIRVSKSSLIIRTLGTLDEANSFLGIATAFSEDQQLAAKLKEIQRNLFSVGSILAGANLRFSVSKTKKLEKEIDKLEGTLPVAKNFILPGGGKTGSLVYMARTLVRAAERAAVKLNTTHEVKQQVLIYLNRLSDYLFMLGREANFKEGLKEEAWRGRGK